MLYSGVDNNVKKIEFLHHSVKSIYTETRYSDFRKRTLTTGDVFPFSADEFEYIETEKNLIELLFCWCVITLESLINHVIVEITHNDTIALLLIENVKNAIEKSGIKANYKSELQYKLVILGDNSEYSRKLANDMEQVIIIRNNIVHDKPFRILQDEDTVEIKKISKYKEDIPNIYYDDLKKYYSIFDSVIEYLGTLTNINNIIEFRFGKLFEEKNA